MPATRLIPWKSCRSGAGVFVEAAGRELAVFRLGDPERAIVIDNACPHSSGNLSAGEVQGQIVTCPAHQWKFDLPSGVCTHSDLARVRRYPAEVREDGFVWADLPNGSTHDV